MYYEEESRQFNVASGLLVGAVLGAGLALLFGPERPGRRMRRLRKRAAQVGGGAARELGRRASGGLAQAREGLLSAREAAAEALAERRAASRATRPREERAPAAPGRAEDGGPVLGRRARRTGHD